MYCIITHWGDIIHGRLVKISNSGYFYYFHTDTEQKNVLIDDVSHCYYDNETAFNNFYKMHPSGWHPSSWLPSYW